MQRRAARQKCSIETSQDAWQRWSSTMEEEIAALTERLVASPAPDTDGLAMAIDVISEKGDDGVRRYCVAAPKS
jgi:hypothetical protein